MTIRIVPKEQLESNYAQKTSVVGHTPLLFLPHIKSLYITRTSRLKQLGKDSPLADYIAFCTQISELQNELVKSMPVKPSTDLRDLIVNVQKQGCAPLSLTNFPLNTLWQSYLDYLIERLLGHNKQIDQAIVELKAKTMQEKQDLATHLLNGEFDQVPKTDSLFIWSALSCYYAQLAAQLPATAEADLGETRQFCPICHSHPTASIVHLGGQASFRYLHCSLCESEWYVPRVKCTNCEESSGVHYYSLDKELAAIKTECCDNCQSYLKIGYQDQDPELEIIADDLASLLLDEETEKAGFAKTGLNPFLLP
ncbi:formate dehydrogenase accessory protein FdhE [Utexia brackfieldae]|uniref:formate dehydrogenase accessory protein FdhE n=1 Tax=Utexia brackfieldae TaxID=3074108 RepID=UPI00370DC774